MTGKELRAWREAQDWSQQTLAEALDVPVNTIARWERAELPIRHGTILRLALQALKANEAKKRERARKAGR